MSTAKILRPKIGDWLAAVRHAPRLWELVPREARRGVAVWLTILAASGALPVASVYLTRDLVDALAGGMGQGVDELLRRGIVLPAMLLGAVLVLGEALLVLDRWLREGLSARIQEHISSLIHERSASVDMAFYDAPEYFDRLHRARNEAWYRPRQMVDTVGGLVSSGVTLLAMGAVLFQFGAVAPLVLLLSTIPALAVVIRQAVRQHTFALESTPQERRAWYCEDILTSARSAAEVRLFDLGAHFRDRYRTIQQRLRLARLKLLRRQELGGIGAGLAALGAAAGCLVWIGLRVAAGALTLGALAQFYLAFRQGQQMLRGLLGQMGDIFRQVLFLGNLFEFLDLKNTVTDPAEPARAPAAPRIGIEIDDVTFAYPGSGGQALKGLNLKIPAGSVAAIVGRNGTGKSTLLKLLCRFYDPDAGAIRFDGVDLRALDMAKLRRLVTVLFQTPVGYFETVARNIELGDLGRDATPSQIEEAARAAGADHIAAGLPSGYDTLLGKWFEQGTELSVGEWQRLALARAFLRDAPIMLLDEPTSAMDSWAEAEWMAGLRRAVAGKTALIVTHRFTTAMQADVIHVMDEGRIVESGTHAELVARGGYYATSWAAQVRERTSPPPA
ncbi:MAG: ABC transporter ATP-binding protein [Deltaproteobacteria bacterium]|nr:ABC transporter ATP-binding protein [Deltaproteobacteria bacterium]